MSSGGSLFAEQENTMFDKVKKPKSKKRKVLRYIIAGVLAVSMFFFLRAYFTAGSLTIALSPAPGPFAVALKCNGRVTSFSSNKGKASLGRLKAGDYRYAVSSPGYISSFGSVRVRPHTSSRVKLTLARQPQPRSISGPAEVRFPVVLPEGSAVLCWSGLDLVRVDLNDGGVSVVRHLPYVQECSWAHSGEMAVVTLINDPAMTSSTPGALHDPAAGPTSCWIFSPSRGVLSELPSSLLASSLSADGSVIAYTVQASGKPTLVIRRGSSEIAFALPAACLNPEVSLSPSGAQAIVYNRPGDDISDSNIFSVDTSSGVSTKLTSCGYISSARYDDAGNIVFQHWETTGKSSLIWYIPAGSRDAFSTGFSANLTGCSFAPGGVLIAPCSSGEQGSSSNSYSLVYSVPAEKISSSLIDSLPDKCCFVGARGSKAVLILGDSQNSWYVFDFEPTLIVPRKGGM